MSFLPNRCHDGDESELLTHCGQPLVHFRSSFLHSSFLDEATGQFTVILSNPGCSLLHHFSLLWRWRLVITTNTETMKDSDMERINCEVREPPVELSSP